MEVKDEGTKSDKPEEHCLRLLLGEFTPATLSESKLRDTDERSSELCICELTGCIFLL
jgi:hypothetical protein